MAWEKSLLEPKTPIVGSSSEESVEPVAKVEAATEEWVFTPKPFKPHKNDWLYASSSSNPDDKMDWQEQAK